MQQNMLFTIEDDTIQQKKESSTKETLFVTIQSRA